MNLNSEVQYLKGVGPRRAAILAGVGIKCLRDLLYFLPRRYIDRSMIVPIDSLKANMTATVIGKVMGSGILMGRRKRLEVVLGDDSGYISLIWFAGYKYLEKMFKKGDVLSVTGQVTYFQQRQIVHPEVERIEDEAAELIHTGRIVPVYPSTAALKKAGITGRAMRQMVSRTLEMIGDISDYLPEKYHQSSGLPRLGDSLRLVHYPEKMEDAENSRRRLAYDELLDLQYLILKSRKEKNQVSKSHNYDEPRKMVKGFYRALPFKLTSDQSKSTERIFADLRSDRPMHRLLQGDVGCGKTVVALLASVYAAENDLQTAFMAPTELLAEQHYQNWRKPLEDIGLNCSLMIGAMTAAERREANEAVASGQSRIVFGTHAVISESVQFQNLGLVIIDEQHRFGVMQRGKLIGKGQHPDTLVMTATPIPRTLALTLYGDLDISSIKTMPPGRKPTKTVWRSASTRPEIYKYLRTRLAEQEQIFFIYPLVEKSEKLDLQAAEDEYKRLKSEIFTEYRVGLVHGRMKSAQREKAITAFRNKRLDILVSTTVIEVGIDIPSANIMVIEHAERFGLSQLHQLRGRVGRGGQQGTAIAVATSPISDLARRRLEMFVSSTDGFEIAEADLELRGPGEFFGTRQHGLPELTIANLARDTELLTMARDIIIKLLAVDHVLDADDRILLEYLQKKLAGRKSLTRFG
ncbi:MAG: ATP-dependent DNA helicase RecG [candidate division Zixibacteria bacterium HGW-Zixibacteria-1]|nr:MAG: ATP-dependent DNA helicase RecG [candidate division Zixibacteria bacterium HGW-Zixibacteria-1]